MKKMKVIWLCHFSNEEIRSRLPLSNLVFLNIMEKLTGKKKTINLDFAPWISNLLDEFRGLNNIEIHLVSPHKGLKRSIFNYSEHNITYHFFKPELPLFLDKFFNKILQVKKKKYKLNRFLISRLIRKISPDIINLIGTENPYYASAVLDVKNIPVFVTVQTVYTNPERKILSGLVDSEKWDLELKIHQKETYYGCSGRMHRDLILKNNPNAIIFKNFFPIKKPPNIQDTVKHFDFVFFAAQVALKKGIEDAIDALEIVKEEYPNVTLNIVGECAASYKKKLLEIINSKNLTKNIVFNEYFPLYSDLQQHLMKSKFALLPVKLDIIPGTILESMLLKIPVVTYKTSGTPYLNKDTQTILISEIGDIKELSSNMSRLMENPKLGKDLAIKAKEFVEKEFENKASAKRLQKIYFSVHDHYTKNVPIPKDLLFNIEEFPIY